MQPKDLTKIFIASFILVFGIFLWKYLDDYFDYKKYIKSKSLKDLDHYFDLHPDGWFKSEINERIEELAFAKVKTDSSESAINDYLQYSDLKTNLEEVLMIQFLKRNSGLLVRDFIAKYPHSRFMSYAEKKYKELWEDQILYFDSVVKPHLSGPNRKLIDFYRGLLLYMKEKNKYEFVSIFKSKKEFKSYKDYPKETRDELKFWHSLSETNSPAPSLENVYEIGSYFPSFYLYEKERETGEKLKASIYSFFNPEFFTYRMVISDEPNKMTQDKDIDIELNYKIKNEEDGYRIPVLLEHVSFPETLNKMKKVFKGYAMAIEAEFNIVLFNPGTQKYFKSTRTIKQPEMDENFERLNEGYEKLINLMFNQFYKEGIVILKSIKTP
jgi:hypothetical protein